GNKRHMLVKAAAKNLAEARMIDYNEVMGALAITDLERIAEKYYIGAGSIEIFNKEFKPVMSEANILRMLSVSL
ncbi:hypothetical protein M422DRAFT_116775, partial [Sphaerobolus stellatus SS14]